VVGAVRLVRSVDEEELLRHAGDAYRSVVDGGAVSDYQGC
jgi:hypothetical protein